MKRAASAKGSEGSAGERRKPLIIAGERIAPGETKTLSLKFSESYLGAEVYIPIRVLRAKAPGPRVLITGCIHGDELNGMGIIRELLYGKPPSLLRGTLVCIPVVNVYGLENHNRYLPDRRDLNRSFPGTNSGSMSSRLARMIFSEIVEQCDCLIDFHSAAVRRTNYPSVRADMSFRPVREIAKAFGCELIINTKGPIGSLRRAMTATGRPAINVEAGEVWKIEPGVVEVGVQGITNVLKHLEMVRGEPIAARYQVRIDRTVWVRAEKGGTLSFGVNPGDTVEKGQVLGSNYSIFGHERRQTISPYDGVVLGMATMPVVKPGDPIYHLAIMTPATLKRVRKRVAGTKGADLFDRIHVDLATNVHEV